MSQTKFNIIELFYNEAIETQKGVFQFTDFNPKPLNFLSKIKAKRAIDYFQKVLEFIKDDFRVFFFIGKNYQSLRVLIKL